MYYVYVTKYLYTEYVILSINNKKQIQQKVS